MSDKRFNCVPCSKKKKAINNKKGRGNKKHGSILYRR